MKYSSYHQYQHDFHCPMVQGSYKCVINSQMFINKLCMKDEKHFHVDHTNISIVLDSLGKCYQKDETAEIIETAINEIKIAKSQFRTNIKKKQFEKECKHRLKWGNFFIDTLLNIDLILPVKFPESIKKDVQKLEKTSGLKFSIPHSFNSHSMAITIDTPEKCEQIVPEYSVSSVNYNEFRLKHINFGYALLNVGSREDILKHLRILLDKLSGYNNLQNYERSFCRYLLNSIGMLIGIISDRSNIPL